MTCQHILGRYSGVGINDKGESGLGKCIECGEDVPIDVLIFLNGKRYYMVSEPEYRTPAHPANLPNWKEVKPRRFEETTSL